MLKRNILALAMGVSAFALPPFVSAQVQVEESVGEVIQPASDASDNSRYIVPQGQSAQSVTDNAQSFTESNLQPATATEQQSSSTGATGAIDTNDLFAPVDNTTVTTQAIPAEAAPAAKPGDAGGLYLQVQQLQQQVLQLSGVVEEQAKRLKDLETARFDDFVSLDQRVAVLENGQSVKAGSSPTTANGAVPASVAAQATAGAVISTAAAPAPVATSGLATAVSGPEEKAAYDSAFQLLKDRKLDQAKVALNAYLDAYPLGFYAPNAYYWIGEIVLDANDLEGARSQFTALLKQFPDSRKAQDAKYKLGVVYYRLNQPEKSKAYFEDAASGSGSSAKLAERQLKKLF